MRANHLGRGSGVAHSFAKPVFKLASAERITEDEMHQIIELAEADKLKKAILRIQETEKSLSQGGKK